MSPLNYQWMNGFDLLVIMEVRAWKDRLERFQATLEF